jgi:hypothetical protein
MINARYRSLYRWLVQLHPPAFRQRFAEEMLCTFEEAAQTRMWLDCSPTDSCRLRGSGCFVQMGGELR